jgi:hypothetical protein
MLSREFRHIIEAVSSQFDLKVNEKTESPQQGLIISLVNPDCLGYSDKVVSGLVFLHDSFYVYS